MTLLRIDSMALAIEAISREATNGKAAFDVMEREPIPEAQREDEMLKNASYAMALAGAAAAAASSSRIFFPDFGQVDAKARANPGRLKDGQSTREYPKNGAREMVRRRRQMEKANAKV